MRTIALTQTGRTLAAFRVSLAARWLCTALPANCAMKIEFLTNYDSSNPKDCIFRIYDFNSEEVKKLVVIFREVAEGVTPEIDLGHQNFICPIGGVTLELRLGSIDEGIFQISDNNFLCTLSKSGWENAINLA